MMRPRRLLLPLASLLLLGAAAVPAVRAVLNEDYEHIPPDPAETHALLAAQPKSILDAIAVAKVTAPDGEISEVRFVDGGKPRYFVHLVTPKDLREVEIDAADGNLLSSVVKPPFTWPGAAVAGEWTETASGLKYWDLVEGSGPVPPGPTSQVKVHYTGWLLNGKKFDSSVDRGQPATFPLNRVISGWTEGVGSMKVGGKRKLVIPFDLAYGPNGRPPTIPPRATLVFDVELLEIVR